METLTPTKNYQKLLQDLTQLLYEGERKALEEINKIRVETYWRTGKRIVEEKEMLDAETAPLFITNLSRDLKMDVSLLRRIVQFYNTYPDGLPSIPNGEQLTWAHHYELLGVKDSQEREFYLKTAAAKGWGKGTLRKAVRSDLFSTAESAPDSDMPQKLKRDPNPLYTYKAVVDRVIDGDTLIARIDLGFDVWVNQRLRFRGVNTEELNPSVIAGPMSLSNGAKQSPDRAQQAKQFVEEKLKDLDFVVIKSYKTDIYGRYVVDLFYHPALSKKEEVAKQGFFLNAQLLEAGLADLMVW